MPLSQRQHVVENDLDLNGPECNKEQNIAPDPWEPWSNGPMLRHDSFTARQLYFLTPEAISLENRKIFIGQFPSNWIETNTERWFCTIRKRVERIACPAYKSLRAVDSFRPAAGDLRRITELQMATSIARETDSTIRNKSVKRKQLMKAMRVRRYKFRKSKLSQVEIDAGQAKGAQKSFSDASNDVKNYESRDAEIGTSNSIFIDNSRIANNDKNSDNNNDKNDDIKTDKADDPTNNANSRSLTDTESCASSETLFYDCDQSLKEPSMAPVKSLSEISDTSSHVRPLVSEATSPGSDRMNKKPYQVKPGSIVKIVEPTEQDPNVLKKSSTSSKPHEESTKSRKKPRIHIRLHKKANTQVFQGRFLVQERKSSSTRPVVSETEAPLETQLVSRWKECSVLVRQTGNPSKPLILYFYDNINHEKLARRSKRRWTQSLVYRIPLDPYYEVSLYSPLDMTLALWRPKVQGEKRSRNHHPLNHGKNNKSSTNEKAKYGTRILLIQSQSLPGIMDLAYLLCSATRGAPWLNQSVVMSVSVPSIGVNVQLKSRQNIEGALEEIRRAQLTENSLMSYNELLSPVVSGSWVLKNLMRSIWNITERLPRKLQISAENETSKFTLAWITPGLEHRPLWFSSASSKTFPLLWLNWLMSPNSSLAMVQPTPRCHEVSNSYEPEAIEGYCSKVLMCYSSRRDKLKPAFNSKHNFSQYIFTADNYLLLAPAQNAEPPMLASNQNTIEKVVEPYPLDESRQHITWMKYSTCLQEVDYHDIIAKLELERRSRLLTQSRGMLNMVHMESFESNEKGEVRITDCGGHQTLLCFESEDVAKCWVKRLKTLSYFWKQVFNARKLQRTAKSLTDFNVTSYLQNRCIVYSSPLFMKRHQFATFKSYWVILTTNSLVIYKIDQTKRPPARISQNIPFASYMHRHYITIDLRGTYIYTGQAARHIVLNGDAHLDASNPGVRALPRAYEDGWTSQDTEIERCFVIWQKKEHIPIVSSHGKGRTFAFLAQEKNERDKWVTALRYVQTTLSSKEEEYEEYEDLNIGDEAFNEIDIDDEKLTI